MQSSLLDIIFERRNQSYGAYPLRKFYHARLYRALGVVFAIAVGFCFFSVFNFAPKEKLATHLYEEPMLLKVAADAAPLKKPDVAKSRPLPAVAALASPAGSHIVIAKDSVHVPPLTDNNGAQTAPSATAAATIASAGGGGAQGPSAASVQPAATAVPVADPNEVHSFADVMPAFPGGEEALKRFLIKNLQNPQELEEGQAISVKIRFVVGIDGKLKGFETLQDGGQAFNNEVTRVLKKMPDWIPGKTHGQNVSVYYVLPVNFVAAE